MRLLLSITILIATALTPLSSQDKPAYYLYRSNGVRALYSDLVHDSINTDVVFFGELHDNPIAHWLELELVKDIHSAGRGLIIGAEMMESDNQLIIDEYLSGLVHDTRFEEEARLWPNYKTDYKPLLQFARDNRLPFIATNVPRRYASLVFRKGLDSLTGLNEEARRYIAPLPIYFDKELKSYRAMTEDIPGSDPALIHAHGKGFMPEAQALKDATMAWFISRNLKENSTFVHINGAYHSNYNEGIVYYLKKNKDNVRIITLNTVLQDSMNKLDEKYRDSADYILVVPSAMTSTYK